MNKTDYRITDDIDKVMGFIYSYYIKMHKNIKLDYLLEKLKEQDKSFSTDRLNFALKKCSENKYVLFTKTIADDNLNGILNWHIKEIQIAGINYIEELKKDKSKNKLFVNIELVLFKPTLI